MNKQLKIRNEKLKNNKKIEKQKNKKFKKLKK